MHKIKIPVADSFQSGRLFRKGDPSAAAWKYIKRIGTVDNLQKIAEARKTEMSFAQVASLRIRQSLELYHACSDTSTLTRPLLMYYSALNLLRGGLIVRHGAAGTSHGMKYQRGPDLLSCAAKITADGTFRKLLDSLGGYTKYESIDEVLTLKQVLAQIPELRHEFKLVGITEPLISQVHVGAYFGDDTELRYYIPGMKSEEFSANWKSLLPWFSEMCGCTGEFTLTLKTRLDSSEKAEQFCRDYLWRDLQRNEHGYWFDQVVRPGAILLPRVAAYLAGLYILSNVSRYEPEALMPAMESTDLAFVIESFLDCAARSIPLLVIELFEGPTYFEA